MCFALQSLLNYSLVPGTMCYDLKTGIHGGGFPGGASYPPMQKTQENWVWSLGQEGPPEECLATHSVSLPGESQGQRSLESYQPWSRKESDMTEVT